MSIRDFIIQEAREKIKAKSGGLNQEYTFSNTFNHLIKHSITGAIAGGALMAHISSHDNNGEIDPVRVAAGALIGSTVSGLAGALLGPAMSYGLRKVDEKLDSITDKMLDAKRTKK